MILELSISLVELTKKTNFEVSIPSAFTLHGTRLHERCFWPHLCSPYAQTAAARWPVVPGAGAGPLGTNSSVNASYFYAHGGLWNEWKLNTGFYVLLEFKFHDWILQIAKFPLNQNITRNAVVIQLNYHQTIHWLLLLLVNTLQVCNLDHGHWKQSDHDFTTADPSTISDMLVLLSYWIF